MNNREKLPFRKNCEGYLICDDGKIIARDTGKGYIELPGGGVDDGEDLAEALAREAHEEAGVILKGSLRKKEMLRFIWDKDWAKTDKQKKRYEKFKGEEMYFFIGEVKELIHAPGDSRSGEKGWEGERRMTLNQAMNIINQGKPFPKDIKPYREIQLRILKSLK